MWLVVPITKFIAKSLEQDKELLNGSYAGFVALINHTSIISTIDHHLQGRIECVNYSGFWVLGIFFCKPPKGTR